MKAYISAIGGMQELYGFMAGKDARSELISSVFAGICFPASTDISSL